MHDADQLTTIPCPNCRQPMQNQDLQHVDHGSVRVELCFGCAGIWFDHLASVNLAPAAVITLFQEIQARRDDPRQPVAPQLTCPRCMDGLALSHDMTKAGKFSYYRCLRGDGRFTPFFQFLREKQFVRSLSPAELQHVRSQVRQIACSECGAPIDLEHESVCRFCHAPVSFLDPDAVESALNRLKDADDRHRAALTPEAVASALKQIRAPQGASNDGVDLIIAGIHAIGRLFNRDD
jgi:hypothetical protein